MAAQSLTAACIKTLSKSELYDQKELNGVMALKALMGAENKEMIATFFLRGSELQCHVSAKWYDARESHATRSEFRLYYENNPVIEQAKPGDNIVIGFDKKNNLTCILFKTNNDEHQGYIHEWTPL
ncbi:type II restriction endonuclease [Pantoea sp. SGAir0183]